MTYIFITPPTAPGDPVLKPWMTRSLAVLVGAPMLAALMNFLSLALQLVSFQVPEAWTFTALFLFISPAVSWAVLLVMLPISLFCVRAEIGGWGIAVAAGTVIGGAFGKIFSEGNQAVFYETFGHYVCGGIILALLFWGSIRYFHPLYIGIGRDKID